MILAAVVAGMSPTRKAQCSSFKWKCGARRVLVLCAHVKFAKTSHSHSLLQVQVRQLPSLEGSTFRRWSAQVCGSWCGKTCTAAQPCEVCFFNDSSILALQSSTVRSMQPFSAEPPCPLRVAKPKAKWEEVALSGSQTTAKALL